MGRDKPRGLIFRVFLERECFIAKYISGKDFKYTSMEMGRCLS